MGEIAEMMLEGLLDEQTGEYIGEQNESLFGSASPGFPVSYEEDARSNPKNYGKPNKVKCDICGKSVKQAGLEMHKAAVH